VRDIGDVAILPGLVNAHTHLELSWMAGRVPPAESLPDWIRALLEQRRRGAATPGTERHAAERAAQAMKATGTVLIGDVSNGLATPEVIAGAGLTGVVFHELIGFAVEVAEPFVQAADERMRATLVGTKLDGRVVAHAPYSVSPALFGAIARLESAAPLTVHLGESPEEVEFLRSGTGAFRALIDDLGAWNPGWRAPACDPVEYLSRVGYLQPGLLAAHATHLDLAALERLAAADATVVTCPRSNVWVGAGLPPVARFYASGVRVAIGTDSLASVGSLNLFDELAEIRRIAPDVAAASILESATRVGAESLGFGRSYGTIAPGKRAALIAVDVPAGVTDVEEYLVSGVPADAVHPLF
jgi:cytosine/adenosine deaminase-related metal-dependent hydrolase